MKKIALIIADLDLGGGQRVAINLAEAFAKRHQVTLIIFCDDEIHYQPSANLVHLHCPEKQGIPAKVYNVFKRATKLHQHFKQQQYDHIFSFMETANFPVAMASREAVVSVHCNPRKLLSFFEKLLVRLTYHRAKKVIAVSDDVADILREDYGLTRVARIYNPVNLDEIAKQTETPYQHPKPYMVALGRLNEVKRFDLLIEAYANSKAQQHCDLILIGDGEMRPSLEQQITQLDLIDKVHLIGVKMNPYPYLAGAEFLVLSSRTEAFPMVLVEALATKCPVIATDCPTGPREIVKQGKNGLLVENENTNAITDAIDQLYFDQALQNAMRSNALASIQHLSSDEIIKEWLEI
ncbi:MAG TPA: glycosyltransferase [Leucothrix mucor]|uniref:Glycosyltransferase n=1 Tax=Leucothrix mucor TaxID=45248 RepID=A0A7V2T4G3_LEUMU|nr:glycosyltransferase [Leucothrix mucor]